MTFRIEQVTAKPESFGNYRYRIYEDSRLIAHYWHDYRGDEHGIEFLNATNEACPVGQMTDFIYRRKTPGFAGVAVEV